MSLLVFLWLTYHFLLSCCLSQSHQVTPATPAIQLLLKGERRKGQAPARSSVIRKSKSSFRALASISYISLIKILWHGHLYLHGGLGNQESCLGPGTLPLQIESEFSCQEGRGNRKCEVANRSYMTTLPTGVYESSVHFLVFFNSACEL